MTSLLRVLVVVGLVGVLTGCAVGPNYRRPSAPVPESWKEMSAASSSPEMAGQWKAAAPRDGASRGKWWESFGDPQLNALLEQVSITNQNVAQAEAQWRSARAAIRVARADLLPTVSATAGVTRSTVNNRTATVVTGTVPNVPAATATGYSVVGDVSWELDIFGRIRRNVEGSVATAQATEADLENVRLIMQSELAADYVQLRGIDAEKRLLDTNAEAYDRALQLTVNRHDQGVVSGVDVAQAETQLYTTRAQSIDLSLTRAQFEHAIAALIGKTPHDFSIASDTKEYAPPATPVELPSELLERRPDIAASERRVAAANAQVGVATAAFFPQLLLAASGGYGSSTLSDLFNLPNRFWSIGPTLVATLFQGGKRRALREQTVAAYDSSVAVYRQSVLTAFQEVEDNLAGLRILADEARQQQQATAAAERALELARNRYEGGITTYLEVVTAQVTSLANERVSIELATRRLVASVNLVRALGGGWQDSELRGPAVPAAPAGEPIPPMTPAPASPTRTPS